ncbi:hypothetical protein Btru_000523 [Bulinus truncatus]|nr:hypothetical protein Btru_000523 [Bulinus truncatus]
MNNGSESVGEIKLPDWTWVQCDTCLKWRRLPEETDPKSLPKLWNCSMNEDALYNRCFAEQESEDEEETKERKNTKSSSEKKTEKKSRKRTKASTQIVEKATPVKRTKTKRNVSSVKDTTKKDTEKINTMTNKNRSLPSAMSDSEDDGETILEPVASKKTVRRRLKLNKTSEVLFQAQCTSDHLSTNSPQPRSQSAKDSDFDTCIELSLPEIPSQNKPDKPTDLAQSAIHGLNNIVSKFVKKRSNGSTQSYTAIPSCPSWSENVDTEDSSDLETISFTNEIGKRKEERGSNETDLVTRNINIEEDAKKDKSVQAEVFIEDKSVQTEEIIQVKPEMTDATHDPSLLTLFHYNVHELLKLMSSEEKGQTSAVTGRVGQASAGLCHKQGSGGGGIFTTFVLFGSESFRVSINKMLQN